MTDSKQILLTVFLLTFLLRTYGQTSELDKIEREIKKNGPEIFHKKYIDLNNDGADDVIYTYQCGEPKCIKVFLNIDGLYKEQINEQYVSDSIWHIRNNKMLYLRLTHCCGESPFYSSRLFEFDLTSAKLKDNYVLTNSEYTGQTSSLTPETYLPNQLSAKISIDKCNLRFSPSLEKLKGRAKENFTYACEEGTNIIAKLKLGSTIKILAEAIHDNRTWLFVEIEKNTIAGSCNPLDFDFKGQKLRGWLSDKCVDGP